MVVQCMRHITENSPGCSTAKYADTGGRRQYITQCWKPRLARRIVGDRIGTVTGCIRTLTGRIGTGYSAPFALNQSLLYNRLHTLSVLQIFLPR